MVASGWRVPEDVVVGPDGGAPEAEFRSMAQLRMLHSLARRLNQLNDVGEIGETIAAELRTLIDYHNCRVHLLDDDGVRLIPIAFRGELSEYQGETFEALVTRVGQGITGRVAKTGIPYYTADAAADPYAVQIPGTPEIDESILVVPLRYGDQVIGTISLSKLGIDQFDPEDMRLFEVLASHAAVAIQNARLLERERQAALTARELLKYSKALTRLQDVRAVLEEALGPIPAMIPCSGVQIYLRDPATGAFALVDGQGDGVEGMRRSAEVPAEVAGRFLLSVEEPFVLPREVVATLPARFHPLDEPREVLVAPVRWEPDGLGAVVILAPTPTSSFSRRDLELARGIADITSLALGSASRIQELEATTARLRALDEMKTMFLDAVSHELRTPLAAVLGIALTLERQEVQLSSEEVSDLLNRLAGNARKLDRLLADLLDLERLARGVIEPNLRLTNVGDLVSRVAGAMDFGHRTVVVDETPAWAQVDPPKVERIVENLLANTIRHTPERATVWVRVDRDREGVLLVVEDDGPGVPEDLRRRVFDPFTQGPQRSAHAPGVGIGLSLVDRFARLHGGRAWVEERPGGGASFRVLLPDPGPTGRAGATGAARGGEP